MVKGTSIDFSLCSRRGLCPSLGYGFIPNQTSESLGHACWNGGSFESYCFYVCEKSLQTSSIVALSFTDETCECSEPWCALFSSISLEAFDPTTSMSASRISLCSTTRSSTKDTGLMRPLAQGANMLLIERMYSLTTTFFQGHDMDGAMPDIWNSLQGFPSGHSASSFAAAVFLSLYLNAKLKVFSDHASEFWAFIVILLPLIGASLVSGSMYTSYVSLVCCFTPNLTS